MNFNSYQFLLFFPVVVAVYFSMPYRWRWLWLLLASCYFYMTFIPVYILILFLLIGVDYVVAILIEESTGRWRKFHLVVSIFSTCLILFIFKYFNFFNMSLAPLARFLHWNYGVENLSLILPLGLSFHTFQSLSYVIEVYRGKQKAERHLGLYALYVMFFPQLVSGPIERPYNLLPQIREKHDFDYRQAVEGLKLMVWGFFQKEVIADRLALVVNHVYESPADHSGFTLLMATIFFAFQVYCDFSGYSDIAIGAAQVMGFRLMQNFNRPYFSQSIAEFWHRWHISLSTWFRDYIYISLGGNRVAFWQWQINIMIAFLLSGLWHGASWTFVIWGFLHGVYYLCSGWTRPMRSVLNERLGLNRAPVFQGIVRTVTTFALVCFAWIFFRAANVNDAFVILVRLANGWTEPLLWQREFVEEFGVHQFDFYFGIFLIFSLLAFEGIRIFSSCKVSPQKQVKSFREVISRQPLVIRWAIYIVAILIIMNYGIAEDIPFIYFQF